MAHTNETVNYGLSQFVGTDIPNPLVDYNGDMAKIDTAIKNVADAAVSEGGRITALETQNGSEVLQTTAQTLSGAVNELDGEVSGIDTRLTTAEGKIIADESTLATAVGNISTLAGKVSGLETKVGSAVLTTVAQDCSGAINELKNEIDGGASSVDTRIAALETQNGSEVLQTTAQTLSGAINELYNAPSAGVTAADVSFDGTASGLVATNVQDAIDEVAQDIPTSFDANDVVYDNTTSGMAATNVQDAIDELAQSGGGVERVYDDTTSTTFSAAVSAAATTVLALTEADIETVFILATTGTSVMKYHITGLTPSSEVVFVSEQNGRVYYLIFRANNSHTIGYYSFNSASETSYATQSISKFEIYK